MMIMRRKREAFTLLEMLMVLGLMGLLGGITTAGIQGIRGWMEQQAQRSFLFEIQTAMRLYWLEHHAWPPGIPGSEFGLGPESEELSECLQPYMESPLSPEFLDRELSGQRLRVVLDTDHDHWILATDFSLLIAAERPERLWERVAVYVLNPDGTLGNSSWGR